VEVDLIDGDVVDLGFGFAKPLEGADGGLLYRRDKGAGIRLADYSDESGRACGYALRGYGCDFVDVRMVRLVQVLGLR
jgi:hypothetical protein